MYSNFIKMKDNLLYLFLTCIFFTFVIPFPFVLQLSEK